jgi:uncharacterized protein YggE
MQIKPLFIACAFSLLFSAPAMAEDTVLSTLDISSTVEVKADPNIAVISAGVVTSAPTAAAAMHDNATGMTEVYGALKAAGVTEKDIQTSGINLQAQYDYRQNETPRVTGYQAVNTVTITLRDLAAAGTTLDALVAQGVNQINGPTFTIENPDTVLDKARAEAVKKAANRAELYAQASGLKVKRILSISENTGYNNPEPRPMMMRAMSAESAGASTPVAPGQVGLSATVNVRYEIAP